MKPSYRAKRYEQAKRLLEAERDRHVATFIRFRMWNTIHPDPLQKLYRADKMTYALFLLKESQ